MALNYSTFYDGPNYVTRQNDCPGEAGGASNATYDKYAFFTTTLLYSVSATVTVAGTAAGHVLAIFQRSGTATVTLGTMTLGTQAAGSVVLLQTSGAVGPLGTMAPGDYLIATTGTDTTGKALLALEYQLAPMANVTHP